jgi:hypothetical protein
MMGPEPMIITLLMSSRLGIHPPSRFIYIYTAPQPARLRR